jgi:hypothetical protein
MKRVVAFAAALALSVVMFGAQAQKPSPGKMGRMATPGMMKPPAAKKGVTGTSHGTVKGAPTAAGFVLTTAKGDVTVDTSSAKFRNGSGQFVKATAVTPGAPADVHGTWKGRTLVADSVKLTALKAAPAGGKMGGKMGGAPGRKLPK